MINKKVLVLDAGTGNLHSVANSLQRLGAAVKISENPVDVEEAERVVLPGVGAFAKFMDGMRLRNLVEATRRYIDTGKPLLGICVGMQAFFQTGEELGNHAGLGILQGKVVRFQEEFSQKVPHTGWNQLRFQNDCPLTNSLDDGVYTYFNHSYYCIPQDKADSAATTEYGIEFCSIVWRENMFGVQFHPEKSQRVGLQILENFLRV